MNWFEIIKENRLVTQPVTYTKDKGEDPEQDEDGRCKRKLIEKCEAVVNLADELISKNLAVSKSSSYIDEEIQRIEQLPEEVCCLILENLARMVSKKSNYEPFADLSEIMTGMREDSKWHKISEKRKNVEDDEWYVHVNFWASGHDFSFHIIVDTYDESDGDYRTWLSFNLTLTVLNARPSKRKDIIANWLKEKPELIERWFSMVSRDVSERIDSGLPIENPKLKKLLDEFKDRDFSNIEEFVSQLWWEGMMDEDDIIKLAFDRFVEALK